MKILKYWLQSLVILFSIVITQPALSEGPHLKCNLDRTIKPELQHWPRFRQGTLELFADGAFVFVGEFHAFNKLQRTKYSRGRSKVRLKDFNGYIVDLLEETYEFRRPDGSIVRQDDFPKTLGHLDIKYNDWSGELKDINGSSISIEGFAAAEGRILVKCSQVP